MRNAEGTKSTAEIRLDMQNNAKGCAVFRTEETLEECVDNINEVDKSFANVKTTDRSMIWNSDLVETMELQNLLTCATQLQHLL